MLRIIGGVARGRRLKVPKGRLIRPATDQLREALFNILGESVQGATFLDCCAGTGAVGLEAISRGAAALVSVEQDPRVLTVLKENIALFASLPEGELADRVKVIQSSVSRALPTLGARQFDFIYVGAPYADEPLYRAVLTGIVSGKCLAERGRVIVEQPMRRAALVVEGLSVVDQRRYGETTLIFYEVPA